MVAAKNLPFVPGIKCMPSTFVSVTLGNDRWRTEIVSDTTHPEWNFRLLTEADPHFDHFGQPRPEQALNNLLVEVWQVGGEDGAETGSISKLLGKLEMSLYVSLKQGSIPTPLPQIPCTILTLCPPACLSVRSRRSQKKALYIHLTLKCSVNASPCVKLHLFREQHGTSHTEHVKHFSCTISCLRVIFECASNA